MDFIKRFINFAMQHEFIRYVFVGGVATVADWGTFYVSNVRLNVHYQIALVMAWLFGVLVHYTLSRFFAFRSQARQVARQLITHIVISLISLGLSFLAMYILVTEMLVEPMVGRVITTATIFIFNYAMHKYFTFNERWIK